MSVFLILLGALGIALLISQLPEPAACQVCGDPWCEEEFHCEEHPHVLLVDFAGCYECVRTSSDRKRKRVLSFKPRKYHSSG